MKQKIYIKPMSVNAAYTGVRYKTDALKAFKKEFLLKLKPMKLPEGKLMLHFMFGFLTAGSDLDNACKATQDCLAEKYGFNDNRIYGIRMDKVVTKEPFIAFAITPYKH